MDSSKEQFFVNYLPVKPVSLNGFEILRAVLRSWSSVLPRQINLDNLNNTRLAGISGTNRGNI
jgi:hypothetical protein